MNDITQSQEYERGRAEERAKNDVIVSWDIAEGGTEWVVQFWHGKTLLTQLDKNADEGGNFKFSDLLENLTREK